jgi:hypothetical protein
MDYFFDTDRLPSFLLSFVSLSYRVDPPPNPDSFPDSSYYDVGYLDVCLVVTIIAIMAILRDAARIILFEPFANWMLTRDWRRRQALKSGSATPDSKASNVKTNGRINGPVTTIGSAEKLVADRPAEHSLEARRIRHSVVRFAEQGWLVVYYSCQWSLGVVRVSYNLLFGNAPANLTYSTFTITFPRASGQGTPIYLSLALSRCTISCRYLSTYILSFFSTPKPHGKTTGK